MHWPYISTYSGAKLRIPDYNGLSLAQIPVFIEGVLHGSPSGPLMRAVQDSGINLSGVKHVVFCLVDGFGFAQWNAYKHHLKLLQTFNRYGIVIPIDSVFPSSTPVALTTLNSNGAVPSSHGLMDWWLYLEELDQIIATLPFTAMTNHSGTTLVDEGYHPRLLYDGATMFESLQKSGINTYCHIYQEYAHSAYSSVAHRGAAIVPASDAKSLFQSLNAILQTSTGTTYSYVYWGDIDAAGHKTGLNSSNYNTATESYFSALQVFINNVDKSARNNTLVIISADHGQISTDPDKTIFLDEIPGFQELLKISPGGQRVPPWGGPREVFFAVEPGQHIKAMQLLQETIGTDVEVIASEEARKQGLFGHTSTPHPHLKSRVGDIIVLPKRSNTVWFRHPGASATRFFAHHGGLSRDELQVPFALLRPSDV